TADRLERFSSDAALEAYAAAITRQRNLRTEWQMREYRRRHPPRRRLYQDASPAAAPANAPECDPSDPNCGGEDIEASPAQSIVVTGTRATPNITNVQTAGVDEGDVVKQICDFLVVLQDGRIFSVDTRGGRLALADRINVYRDAREDDAWYDEMLVQGNRIIITAYSYRHNATELSVFTLDERSGHLARQGSFLISSEDYYSGDNYATRIIGDNLVIYTPYDVNDLTDRAGRPRIRRWTSPAQRTRILDRGGDDPNDGGRPMMDGRDVYRPLLRTLRPTIHAVTVCPLGDYNGRNVPDCRVTAIAGPRDAEMFVTPDSVYLWVGGRDYDWWYGDTPRDTPRDTQAPVGFGDVSPAAVYRVPVDGGRPSVVGLRGRPINQFSMDETRQTFRALLRWSAEHRYYDPGDPTLVYTNIALREFSNRLNPIAPERHIAMPSPGPGQLENRFADEWLVYGGRVHGYGAIPDPENPADDDDDDGVPDAPNRTVIVVPVAQPQAARAVAVDHNVIRIERVGADRMAINGYRDQEGLSISLLGLGQTPRILDTMRLARRYESEGRSHAFNSLIGADGSGLIGVPTVLRSDNAERYEWFSDGSDVSFLNVAADGRLSDAGPLLQGLKEPAADYACEVSCIDWYGNSRPIFTGGRVFALMATEIAEGHIVDGRMRELRRLNLTGPVPRRP
ncbi:MAG: beta-propeller domain-containing protein, partial [Novosphingobium sp.]